MKKLALLALFFAGLSTSSLFGQTFTGTWQGSVKVPQAPNGELRTVIKISVNEGDKLTAIFYSIDQGARPLSANAVTASGSILKLSFVGMNGEYEGRLSADGNTIEGTFTQGQPRPLTLTRATPQTAWTIPEPSPPPVRMTAADPGFEVATIKPSEPGRPGKLFTVRGQNIVTLNTSLRDLITEAWGIHSKQLTGAPSWIDSDKYDLTIKPDAPGQPGVAQLRIILQKVITDRFQLKFHHEKRELAVYAITIAKSGAKLTKSQSDPKSLPGLFFQGAPTGLVFNVRNATMAEVGGTLQGAMLDRPVVDQTGLTDKYDFSVKFTPDRSMGPSGAPPSVVDSPDAPPDIFAAFEQQLGLKLTSTKADADVLIIDRVEKPSEN